MDNEATPQGARVHLGVRLHNCLLCYLTARQSVLSAFEKCTRAPSYFITAAGTGQRSIKA
jgi:hypothetical protein